VGSEQLARGHRRAQSRIVQNGQVLIHGACHCGNIAFDLAWDPDPTQIPARACGCTFCVKHGGLWTSNPRGTLAISIRDPQAVSKYAFGTHTADFHVCARCGVAPVVTSQIDGHTYAVVSVNAFEGIDRGMLKTAPASFDAEDEGMRLARRKRNWIANVTFETGDGVAFRMLKSNSVPG
jgi:hypothetical protein